MWKMLLILMSFTSGCERKDILKTTRMEKHNYICNNCQLSLNDHISDRMYAIDSEGKRIMCLHPAEEGMAYQILGNVSKEEFSARTGVMYPYICLYCAHEFQLDIKRDINECPNCHSKNFGIVPKMEGKN